MHANYGEPVKVGKLPRCGKAYEIYEGYADNATQAQRFANGDTSKYLPSMISQLVLFDREYILPDEIMKLKSKDYHELISKFNEVNF